MYLGSTVQIGDCGLEVNKCGSRLEQVEKITGHAGR